MPTPRIQAVGPVNQPGWQQPVASPPPVYVYAPPTNGMAIAALILAFVFYPLGIVFGTLARRDEPDPRERRGLATAALIIGYLQFAVMVGVIVVAAVLVGLGAQ